MQQPLQLQHDGRTCNCEATGRWRICPAGEPAVLTSVGTLTMEEFLPIAILQEVTRSRGPEFLLEASGQRESFDWQELQQSCLASNIIIVVVAADRDTYALAAVRVCPGRGFLAYRVHSFGWLKGQVDLNLPIIRERCPAVVFDFDGTLVDTVLGRQAIRDEHKDLCAKFQCVQQEWNTLKANKEAAEAAQAAKATNSTNATKAAAEATEAAAAYDEICRNLCAKVAYRNLLGVRMMTVNTDYDLLDTYVRELHRYQTQVVNSGHDTQPPELPAVQHSGQVYHAQREVVVAEDGREVERAEVVHIPDAGIVLTCIHHGNPATAVLVHVRGGWRELRAGLLNRDSSGVSRPLYRVHGCTAAASQYAQEIWHAIDSPQFWGPGHLIPPDERQRRVVSVRTGPNKEDAKLKSLAEVLGLVEEGPEPGLDAGKAGEQQPDDREPKSDEQVAAESLTTETATTAVSHPTRHPEGSAEFPPSHPTAQPPADNNPTDPTPAFTRSTPKAYRPTDALTGLLEPPNADSAAPSPAALVPPPPPPSAQHPTGLPVPPKIYPSAKRPQADPLAGLAGPPPLASDDNAHQPFAVCIDDQWMAWVQESWSHLMHVLPFAFRNNIAWATLFPGHPQGIKSHNGLRELHRVLAALRHIHQWLFHHFCNVLLPRAAQVMVEGISREQLLSAAAASQILPAVPGVSDILKMHGNTLPIRMPLGEPLGGPIPTRASSPAVALMMAAMEVAAGHCEHASGATPAPFQDQAAAAPPAAAAAGSPLPAAAPAPARMHASPGVRGPTEAAQEREDADKPEQQQLLQGPGACSNKGGLLRHASRVDSGAAAGAGGVSRRQGDMHSSLNPPQPRAGRTPVVDGKKSTRQEHLPILGAPSPLLPIPSRHSLGATSADQAAAGMETPCNQFTSIQQLSALSQSQPLLQPTPPQQQQQSSSACTVAAPTPASKRKSPEGSRKRGGGEGKKPKLAEEGEGGGEEDNRQRGKWVVCFKEDSVMMTCKPSAARLTDGASAEAELVLVRALVSREGGQEPPRADIMTVLSTYAATVTAVVGKDVTCLPALSKYLNDKTRVHTFAQHIIPFCRPATDSANPATMDQQLRHATAAVHGKHDHGLKVELAVPLTQALRWTLAARKGKAADHDRRAAGLAVMEALAASPQFVAFAAGTPGYALQARWEADLWDLKQHFSTTLKELLQEADS